MLRISSKPVKTLHHCPQEILAIMCSIVDFIEILNCPYPTVIRGYSLLLLSTQNRLRGLKERGERLACWGRRGIRLCGHLGRAGERTLTTRV